MSCGDWVATEAALRQVVLQGLAAGGAELVLGVLNAWVMSVILGPWLVTGVVGSGIRRAAGRICIRSNSPGAAGLARLHYGGCSTVRGRLKQPHLSATKCIGK